MLDDLRHVQQVFDVPPHLWRCTVARTWAMCSASNCSATSCEVKAFVDATPISGPACV